MSDRPKIPGKIKRELRQEAYFGCVKCGCPIIEYHHIEPWSKVKKHEKNNLVVLCPVCHHEANTGAYDSDKIREYKKNPINKTLRFIQRNFMLRDFNNVVVQFGNVRIINARNILQILKCRIIYFNLDDDGAALLNAVFFDEQMRVIAIINDNEWKTIVCINTYQYTLVEKGNIISPLISTTHQEPFGRTKT